MGAVVVVVATVVFPLESSSIRSLPGAEADQVIHGKLFMPKATSEGFYASVTNDGSYRAAVFTVPMKSLINSAHC